MGLFIFEVLVSFSSAYILDIHWTVGSMLLNLRSVSSLFFSGLLIWCNLIFRSFLLLFELLEQYSEIHCLYLCLAVFPLFSTSSFKHNLFLSPPDASKSLLGNFWSSDGIKVSSGVFFVFLREMLTELCVREPPGGSVAQQNHNTQLSPALSSPPNSPCASSTLFLAFCILDYVQTSLVLTTNIY